MEPSPKPTQGPSQKEIVRAERTRQQKTAKSIDFEQVNIRRQMLKATQEEIREQRLAERKAAEEENRPLSDREKDAITSVFATGVAFLAMGCDKLMGGGREAWQKELCEEPLLVDLAEGSKTAKPLVNVVRHAPWMLKLSVGIFNTRQRVLKHGPAITAGPSSAGPVVPTPQEQTRQNFAAAFSPPIVNHQRPVDPPIQTNPSCGEPSLNNGLPGGDFQRSDIRARSNGLHEEDGTALGQRA
jgi:hypothetical protein